MRINKAHISIIVVLLITIMFTYYIQTHYAQFSQLLIQTIQLGNGPKILLMILLSLLSIVLNGVLLDRMVSVFGLHLRFRDSFGLAMVTRLYNYITPFNGGLAVRAFYLKTVRNLPYLHFLTALSGIYVIILLASGTTGMIASFAIWIDQDIFNGMVLAFFATVSAGTLVIAVRMPVLPESKYSFLNIIVKLVNGWHIIKHNRKMLCATSVIACLQLLFLAMRYMVVYSIYDIHISLFEALYIGSLSSLSFIVSITPGNLGITEAISVYSATVIGVGVDEAVAASILLRITNVLVVFIFGPIFSYILFVKKRKALVVTDSKPKIENASTT